MSLFGFLRPTRPVADSFVWTSPDGRRIPIELKPSPRARRLTLRADPAAGAIRVSLHPRASAQRALAFVAEQNDWIARRVAAWPVPRPFADGAVIPVEGAETRIRWIEGRPRRVERADGELHVGGPVEGLAGRIERWLTALARETLAAETREIAAVAGLPVAAVSVRDPRARWGSCTGGGRIAYSWRLILAPPSVRRSVVAHEVAHLEHMHHGPEFWALAEELYDGDMAAARRWLKRHGAGLHWVGRTR